VNVCLNPGTLRRLVISGYVGILLSAIAVIGVFRMRERSQRAHIAAILRFDASVEGQFGAYEYQPTPTSRLELTSGDVVIAYPGGQRIKGYSVSDEPPRLIGWLLPILGEHSVAQITTVDVSDDRFSDEDVDLLYAFPDLRELNLSSTALSDEGLDKVTRFEELQVLDISATAVSGVALQKLSKLKGLKELNIEGIDADDEAIGSLKQALPACWIRR